MDESSLEEVLTECKKFAEIGYKLASGQEKKLNDSLRRAQNELKKTIFKLRYSRYNSPETLEMLEGQLDDIQKGLRRLSSDFREDLNSQRENLSRFSITLFGRTMAGKSTLMEFLTEGNGESIGKGAQRTTRDVRSYVWNGLHITDVPGIGAFEGAEDEQIAFKAAKTADLILFLITDDAPQPAEAECFSRIVKLGKPIICILNVKTSIAENKSIKLALRDIEKKFDIERLDKIRNQFLSFSDKYGQNWEYIPFVYVHLKSAFMSQHADDPEKSKAFYDVSRVCDLEKRIVEQVKNYGKFYRIKTFIDSISNTVLEAMENLLEKSQANIRQDRTIASKRRKLKDWCDKFERNGQSQIKSLIIKINSELNKESASFAEEHFDDEHADRAWSDLLKRRQDESDCQKLLDELKENCNDKLQEISREIYAEMEFVTSFYDCRSLRMERIFDGKKICNWSVIAIRGGLSIAAAITFALGRASAGLLGRAAASVSRIGDVVSCFLPSREEKEREARRQLEKILRGEVDKYCESLQEQMMGNLKIIVERIGELLEIIDKINFIVFELADTQKILAWELNECLMNLNKQIVEEAIMYIGADILQYYIKSVARIPGSIIMIELVDGIVFSREQYEMLCRLLSEKLYFVYSTDNKRELISRVIGREIDMNKINIEDKIGVAHVPLLNVSPSTKNRVRLAQQLSGLLIME